MGAGAKGGQEVGVDPAPTCSRPAQPVLPPAASVPGLALAPEGRGKCLYSISPLLGPPVPLWQSGDKVTLPLLGVREIMRSHSEPRGWKTQSAQSDDIARPPASHRSQEHPNPGQTPWRLSLCLPVPCSSSSPDRTTLDPKLDYTGPGFLCLRAVSSAWNTSPFS